jgi:hypothetical protein
MPPLPLRACITFSWNIPSVAGISFCEAGFGLAG